MKKEQETQSQRMLNVGDKIVRYLGESRSILVIDRVTTTQAIAGGTKLNRVVKSDEIKEVGQSTWSRLRYEIATPEIIEDIRNKIRLEKAKAEIETKLKTVTLEKAAKILEILNA